MELKALTRADVEQLADTPKVFRSGEDYERSGAIFQFAQTPTGITARVHGSYGEYAVTVTNDLKLRCTCPYEGRHCKHMVTVLLRYLQGDGAEIGPSEAGGSNALELTLESLPADALREVVLRLVQDQPAVRRAFMDAVTIPPALLRQQPTDAKRVKELKKAIDKAFRSAGNWEYDYDEEGITVDLSYVLDAALSLNPDDQTEVYWHIVTVGNAQVEDDNLSTEPMEEAIGLYAATVARQQLPPSEKHYYLDTLMDALHWTICGYADVSETIKDALDVIVAEPDDYEYLIQKLQKSGSAEVQDWVIGYYKKLGDDARYLEARQAHLHTEPHFLELADYWQEKGDAAQALATLEAWVSRRDEQPEGARYLPYRPDPASGRGEVLRRLISRYAEAGDDANLCRILMAQARQEGVTLALYQRIQTLVGKLGTWPELRPELLKQARGEERAKIYLHDQEWEKALAFAALPGTEDRVKTLVADGVKVRYPAEAIALYDGLVRAYIGRSNREGYQRVARYAGEVKLIYTKVLNDKAAASEYIAAIRKAHPRRPALLDEFRGL